MIKHFVTFCTVLFFTSLMVSCKKDYTCKGTAYDTEYIFNCNNCSKKKVDDYKAEIESKGYSDVTCDKK